MGDRRWPLRVFVIAYGCTLIASAALVLASSSHPRQFTLATRTLFLARLFQGQLQFGRGRILSAQPRGAIDGKPAFALVQDPWDPKLNGRLPRVWLDVWPPLWNEASVFVGGSIVSATRDEQGRTISEVLEPGVYLGVRGMSAWLPLGLAALPLLPLVRKASKRRHRPGRCAACGYDCRATPDRCPECGTEQTPAPLPG